MKYQMLSFPEMSTVVNSALKSSKFDLFCCRQSDHSASKFVAVAGFSIRDHALQFSKAWSKRLPITCGCKIRYVSNSYCVSVPIRPSSIPENVSFGNPVSATGNLSHEIFTHQIFKPSIASRKSEIFSKAWKAYRDGFFKSLSEALKSNWKGNPT